MGSFIELGMSRLASRPGSLAASFENFERLPSASAENLNRYVAGVVGVLDMWHRTQNAQAAL